MATPHRLRHHVGVFRSVPAYMHEAMVAEGHARDCDLMLVLGSSLTVRPASSLVGLALRSGARAVLVNRGETLYAGAATLRVRAGIGEVLPPTVELTKLTLGAQANR